MIAQQERDRIELERYELALERYERNIKSLEEEKAELEDSYDALYYKALFMDVNVVIVGTGRYSQLRLSPFRYERWFLRL